tara:strand:+ start:36 stop:644 length:609 start_codon:yes stop_codon:yes gene_type:complete
MLFFILFTFAKMIRDLSTSLIKIFLVLTLFTNCSGGDDDADLKGYLQEENTVPDYDNDPIYSKANPKNLPTFWDIFVESAALYGKDLSNITDVEFISEADLAGGTAARALGSCHDYVKIQVDETVFRNLTLGEQLFLMYHEFGHDVFNASHDGGGLMAPNVRSVEYTLFQREVEDFFTGVDYIEWTDEECDIIRELLKTETQ